MAKTPEKGLEVNLEEFAGDIEALAQIGEINKTLSKYETQIAETRRDRDVARRALSNSEAENSELRQVIELFGRVDEANPTPPKWLAPKAPSKSHRATLMLMLSDMHFDEVIRPEEVDGLNAYDREIATKRLKLWAQNIIKLSRHYLSGVTYDGFVLMLGGDSFSGSIHEELKETNADTLYGSLLYWTEMLCAAIDMLADEFGKGYILAVPGNHGRSTRKPRMKLRTRDNLDWALAKNIESYFHDDKRLDFNIPESADVRFEVYGQGHLLAHGDSAKGGGGIGGIWPPVKRYRARLAEHANTIDQPFGTLWLGHYHQLITTNSLVVNGAMKGWDEFAKLCGFAYEPPQQAMALATPERGMTWQAPVFCMDRKAEGW